MILVRRSLWWAVLVFASAVAAEVMARADDAMRSGVPILDSPTHSDLVIRDSLGIRGRPFAVYQKWKLNSAGFRGSEIQLSPRPRCIRVAVMGASETFGYYESPNQEFPQQLADSLKKLGCYEVINAAVVGVSLFDQIELWDKWLSRFRPDIVVIYPSPAFYLSNDAPGSRVAHVTATTEPVRFASRFLDRIHSRVHFPDFIQRRRVAREIAAMRKGKPAEWFYKSVPEERLALFRQHLDSLIVDLHAAGVAPVLITHAIRFGPSLDAENRELLRSWERFTPKVTDGVLLDFEHKAADVVRELARARATPLVDAAKIMNGRTDWFGDAIHLTDNGASVMAASISPVIQGLSVRRVAVPSTAGLDKGLSKPRATYRER